MDPDRTKAAWSRTVEPLIRVGLATKALTTGELVEALFPESWVRTELDKSTRQQLFNLMGVLAQGSMKDCVSRGPEKIIMGRSARGWLWHAPKPKCLHCNGTGVLDA